MNKDNEFSKEKMPKDEAAQLMMDALMKGLKGLQDD